MVDWRQLRGIRLFPGPGPAPGPVMSAMCNVYVQEVETDGSPTNRKELGHACVCACQVPFISSFRHRHVAHWFWLPQQQEKEKQMGIIQIIHTILNIPLGSLASLRVRVRVLFDKNPCFPFLYSPPTDKLFSHFGFQMPCPFFLCPPAPRPPGINGNVPYYEETIFLQASALWQVSAIPFALLNR